MVPLSVNRSRGPVQHFDDILEEKFFKALESLFFEKDNPLETKDEEFENVFRFVTEALNRGA